MKSTKFTKNIAALALSCIGLAYTIPSVGQTGNLIFKEDYGGNDITDPRFSTTGLGSLVSYDWYSGPGYNPLQGCSSSYLPFYAQYTVYKFVKRSTSCGEGWIYDNYTYKDHTNEHPSTEADDQSKGYFFIIDADQNPGQFYEFNMDNLCPGNRLQFSIWAMNINPPSYSTEVGNYLYPNLSIIVTDPSTGDTIKSYSTGNVVNTSTTAPSWQQFTTEFALNSGVTSVNVKVINNAGGGFNGNDFALDDIELRLVGPSPITNGVYDTTVCTGATNVNIHTSFKNKYLYSGSTDSLPVILSDNVYYKWQFNNQNGLPTETWTDVSNANGSLPRNLTTETYIFDYNLASVTSSNAGYYRVVVSAEANPNIKCSFTSDAFHVKLNAPKVSSLTLDGGLSSVVCDSAIVKVVPAGVYTSPVTISLEGYTPSTVASPTLLYTVSDTSFFKGVGTTSMTFKATDAAGCVSSDTVLNFLIDCAHPLPVTYLKLDATLNNGYPYIEWVTGSEINNKSFLLERSINGRDFTSIASINSKAVEGNSTAPLNYDYTDLTATTGINYYRIKQINLDGVSSYSKVVMVNNNYSKADIKIFPNPTSDETTLVLPNNQQFDLNVYNSVGQKVNISYTNQGTGIYNFSTQGLSSGVYYLRAVGVDGNTLTQSFIKK